MNSQPTPSFSLKSSSLTTELASIVDPVTFTLYQQIKGTESFSITPLDSDTPLPEQSVTLLQLQKIIDPDTTRSLYQTLTPPDKLLDLGYSTRFKIQKIIQAHFNLPKPSPTTERYLPLFLALSKFIPGHWSVRQQWSAAMWATNYNESEAAALLHYWGYSQTFQDLSSLRGNSIHSLTKTQSGIQVSIYQPHTIQDRIDAACQAALNARERGSFHPDKTNIETLQSIALSKFFFYQNTYLSLENTYRMSCVGKLDRFLEEIFNPLTTILPEPPQVEEPEFLSPESFILSYSDFTFSTSSKQRQHLQNNNRNACIQNLQRRIGFLNSNLNYSRSDLPPIPDKTFSSAKKFGLITQVDKKGRTPLYRISAECLIPDNDP